MNMNTKRGVNMVKELTKENFKETINSGDKLVLVDFWAEWCSPCLRYTPILKALDEELDGKAIIAKLEVDSAPEIADHYEILSIPTTIIFKNGEIVEQFVGIKSKDDLKKRLGL